MQVSLVAYFNRLSDIPLDELKRRNYRYCLIDVDNSLLAHGQHEASDEARGLCSRMMAAGFDLTLVSNARSERAASLAASFDLPYISEANKPSAKKILAFLEAHQYPKSETLMIGDQIFTDVWVAKRAGISAILLEPLNRSEPWYIRLKRFLEFFVKRILRLKLNQFRDN
ncbi:MAG: YqeG family HAD IIIA-type phosphatase [Eubacteriales bacterium]|nr:YqeG family HAD IIIA-type phosphatase [Eubacteriales bacterium]